MTDSQSGSATSDDFSIEDALFAQYKTSLDSDASNVVATLNFKTDNATVDVDCEMKRGTGELTVRGVNDPESEKTVTEIAPEGTLPSADKPLASAASDTIYYINGRNGANGELQAANATPSLLFDDILGEGAEGSVARE